VWAREAGAPHKLERVCVLLKTAGKLKGVEEGLMKVVEAVFAKPEEKYMHASLMCRWCAPDQVTKVLEKQECC